MADITWPEIEKAINDRAIVLLPVGVIEEHGPHIACGSDVYQAVLQCRLVETELKRDGTAAIVAPPVYWGINTSTRKFPGSFDVKPETMKALLADILTNLKGWGFGEVYILNSHGEGGHNLAILESVRDAQTRLGLNARYLVSDRMARRYGLTGEEPHVLLVAYAPSEGGPQIAGPDFHAGAQETGDMIAFFPDLVRIDRVGRLGPPDVPPGGWSEWGKDARAVTPLGYAGHPAVYNADWSRKNFLADAHVSARAIQESRRAR